MDFKGIRRIFGRSHLSFIFSLLFIFQFNFVRADKCESEGFRPIKLGDWRDTSNEVAMNFIHEWAKLEPEWASQLGLDEYDSKVSFPSYSNNQKKLKLLKKRRADLKRLRNQLQAKGKTEAAYDVQLIRHWMNLQIRSLEISSGQSEVVVPKGALEIFEHLEPLAAADNPQHRKKLVVARFMQYVHGNKDNKPYFEAAEDLVRKHLERRGQKTFPSRQSLEQHLNATQSALKAIQEFLQASGVDGWQSDFELFKEQSKKYVGFLRREVFVYTEEDKKLGKSAYLHSLALNGVQAKPDELIKQSNTAWEAEFPRFEELAKRVADKYQLDSSSPESVIHYLMANTSKKSIQDALEMYRWAGQALVQFLPNLVTLPKADAVVRGPTEIEATVYPYAFYHSSPLIKSHGIRGTFVLPDISKGKGIGADEYFPAVAEGLWAHELRPGHDQQFAMLIENNVSIARRVFFSNSASWEGWALYAESLVESSLSVEAQFMLVRDRLLRIARMGLDPRINLGEIGRKEVIETLARLGLSEEFAEGEVDRYIWDDPGQATTYFYGYTKLLEVRAKVRLRLGEQFDLKKFNDAFLQVGIIPFDDYVPRITRIMSNQE